MDMFMVLQTHINDIMMKRYSKVGPWSLHDALQEEGSDLLVPVTFACNRRTPRRGQCWTSAQGTGQCHLANLLVVQLPFSPPHETLQAKAMVQGGDGKSGPDGAVAAEGSSGGAPLGLTQANFGAKYEQHVAQLQKALDDTHQRIDQIQRETDSLRCALVMFIAERGTGGARRGVAQEV